MHCMNCETQLPQDANFCYRCGTPVGETKSEKIHEIQWEYGEVDWIDEGTFLGRNKNWFYIDVVSPKKGKYRALTSPVFKGNVDNPAEKPKVFVEALDDFVAQLVQDGWEPVSERGRDWYQLRFRRQVK